MRRGLGAVAAVLLATSAMAGPTVASEPEPGVVIDLALPPSAAADAVDVVAPILEQRLWALGVVGGSVERGDDTVTVSLPTDELDLAAETLAGQLAMRGDVTFVSVPADCAAKVVQNEAMPDCLAEVEPLFDGTEVAAAEIGQDEWTSEIVVSLELSPTGAELLDAYAEDVYSRPNSDDRLLAIVVDGVVESVPSINAPRFGGQVTISGIFTDEEANGLATALRSGTLPFELEVREIRFDDVLPSDGTPPPAPPARSTDGLEWTVFSAADRLDLLAIDDFVAVLEPESESVTLTILSDDPELPAMVEALFEGWPQPPTVIGYATGPATDILESVPDRPVALELSVPVPESMAWIPEQGVIIGDAESLDPDATPAQGQVDVKLARSRHDALEAASDDFEAVMQLPGFGGVTFHYDYLIDGGPEPDFDDDDLDLSTIPATLIVGFKGGTPDGVLERLRSHQEAFSWSDIDRIIGDDTKYSQAEIDAVVELIEALAADHGVNAHVFATYQLESRSVAGKTRKDRKNTRVSSLDQFESWTMAGTKPKDRAKPVQSIVVVPADTMWSFDAEPDEPEPPDAEFDERAWERFMDEVMKRTPKGLVDRW